MCATVHVSVLKQVKKGLKKQKKRFVCTNDRMITLNGRPPLQNSSEFDEKVCVLIALTSSVVLDTLRVFRCFGVQ